MEAFIQQFVNGIQQGALYALIAVGYTMVYGVLKMINFAHGDVYMLGAFLAYYALSSWFTNIPFLQGYNGLIAALLLAGLACACAGWLIERFAYRKLRNAPRLSSLITAIGVSFLLENGGVLVFGADPKFTPAILPQRGMMLGPIVFSIGQALLLAVSVVLMIGLRFLTLKTSFGRAMRAVSEDRHAAALMGVNVDQVIALTFMLGAGIAGIGGAMNAAFMNVSLTPYFGLLPGVKAFVAAVLGGIGNIPGAVLGGLLMGLAESFVGGAAGFSLYRDGIAFVVLIIILLLKPSGLLGKPSAEKV